MLRKIYLYFGYYFWSCVYSIFSKGLVFIGLIAGIPLTTIYFVVKISEIKHLPDGECVMMGLFFACLSLVIALFGLVGLLNYADKKSFEFEIKIEGTENDPTNKFILNL